MTIKKNIAVLTGGYSGEVEVSLKSAKTVMSYLKKGQHNPILVYIYKDRWYADWNGVEVDIDKNDFSINHEGEKVLFDFAYVVIHGTPGEDGRLQGYFDMLDIPYSTGDVLNTAITFNKISAKQALDDSGFYTAAYHQFREGSEYDVNQIVDDLGLPLFVKPAEEGSSLGITKVKRKEDLDTAIKIAFKHHDEVLIEGFQDGREITCGVLTLNGKVTALPITEVITEKEFFDYEAKYQHAQTEEITPAQLDAKDYEACQRMTEVLYKKLGCKGIVRVDYILTKKGLCVIEVNTVPGLTDMSFIPQQARAAGIDLTELFEAGIRIE